VKVHCLALGGVDLTSSAGKMTMGLIAVMAEFERDLLVERTQAGLSRAIAQGKVLGRLQRGDAVAALAREFGTGHQSIMRIRQEQTQSLA
jgi:putative DNA-invertase from lambdoid prophage Rac